VKRGEGKYDWEEDRDLRHFTELCAKQDMYVILGIGSFTHGEARNGGFPD
jgi:beta-galactosidase